MAKLFLTTGAHSLLPEDLLSIVGIPLAFFIFVAVCLSHEVVHRVSLHVHVSSKSVF